MSFKPVSNKVNFPEQEEEVLAFWEKGNIFQKSLDQRADDKPFVFYDGPPFATGTPHYGHLLAGTIKDIVPRYQAMQGHYVERRFGWDCHGLPIEALAQDALGLAGTTAIVEKGVGVFNEQCRSMVQTYVDEWRRTVNRMGRWVDFDNDYKTMDTDFMESIWWVFKQLWEKKRIYRAHRIMPYSWKLTTPLSNFEANRNYQDVQDPAITCRFKITGGSDALTAIDGDTYFLAWTTTPWTLPSNLALCVGPDIDYVAAKDKEDGSVYLVAETRLSAYYKKPEEQVDIVARFKGSDLVGATYTPLFPYFADHPGAFRVLSADFVTTSDGTGIVHLAPAYGEDDYAVCRDEGIELVDPLDAEANFTDMVPDFAGRNVKEADSDIIKWLKEAGKLVHRSQYTHSYPFCERTDTPLIYRAIDAWYVKVDDLNEKMLANNAETHWMPGHVGENRFGDWLANARDWNISRNRFWGSCLPIWINENDPDDMICIGSIDELEELSGVRVDDLHKHIVDEVLIERDGKTYRRTPEVLDCWFESGAMPYAQKHYPFENKESFEGLFPADFIAEGLDQTRGWFYTLTVLSTILFDKPAFKNVVVNGMILAADGTKMSKSKKNYPPPDGVIDAYGADALRLYLVYSPVVRGESLLFIKDDEDRKAQEAESGKSLGQGGKTVAQVLRDIMIPWWNSYSFFVTYANIDEWTPDQLKEGESPNLLDRWVMSSLNNLNQRVIDAMTIYDLQNSIRPFVEFIDDLTNWYIRRSRRRFWKSDDDNDKAWAYSTLYRVLKTLSQIGAPYVPFLTENLWQNLRTENDPESVHLCDFPKPSAALQNDDLETQMSQVQSVVEMGRSLRSEYDLKTRQPLKGIHVATREAAAMEKVGELAEVIAEELNVKEVWFKDAEGELATLSGKANFKTLGRRMGKQMKAAAAVINDLDSAVLESLLAGKTEQISVNGDSVDITAEDVVIERIPREGLAVAAEGALVVALETELNDELICEGLAQEFKNKVQNTRKQIGLEVTDRVSIQFTGNDAVVEAVQKHNGYIASEVLALNIDHVDAAPNGVDWDLNGHACTMLIERIDA